MLYFPYSNIFNVVMSPCVQKCSQTAHNLRQPIVNWITVHSLPKYLVITLRLLLVFCLFFVFGNRYRSFRRTNCFTSDNPLKSSNPTRNVNLLGKKFGPAKLCLEFLAKRTKTPWKLMKTASQIKHNKKFILLV